MGFAALLLTLLCCSPVFPPVGWGCSLGLPPSPPVCSAGSASVPRFLGFHPNRGSPSSSLHSPTTRGSFLPYAGQGEPCMEPRPHWASRAGLLPQAALLTVHTPHPQLPSVPTLLPSRLPTAP